LCVVNNIGGVISVFNVVWFVVTYTGIK
jgi:hypothetical protein